MITESLPVDDAYVPLDAYAEDSITLEFSTACELTQAESLLMAGWAEPRIVSRAISLSGQP